jgi:NADH:ubiquinone oxidoreductase subunit C
VLTTIAIDQVFKNAGWLERELIEFLNFTVCFKQDTRNLLLDYNQLINPLFKNFPCEGYRNLF